MSEMGWSGSGWMDPISATYQPAPEKPPPGPTRVMLREFRHSRDGTLSIDGKQHRLYTLSAEDFERVYQGVLRLEEDAAALRDALRWCSGSADFGPGGQAYEGWQKACAPLLENVPW